MTKEVLCRNYPDRCGLLVFLAPVRLAAVLAVLLVGAGRRRSLFTSRHGCRRLREATRLSRGVHEPRADAPSRGDDSQVHRV